MMTLAPLIALLPLRLDSVLRASGSDKEMEGGHKFGKTYHDQFRHLKYRRIQFLEVGIGGYAHHSGGESLAAWRCFFPFATIIGCDISR